MVLTLRSTDSQESELKRLLEDQQNPQSLDYHRWLSPEEFRGKFGLSPEDRDSVTAWLSSQGFTIEEVSAGGRAVLFSGPAGQVARMFRQTGQAGASPQQPYRSGAQALAIPQGISALVDGIVGIDESGYSEEPTGASLASQFTYGGSHFLAPSDFAAIYNVSPLYANGTNGAGQSIAIAGRTNIKLSDVAGFRSYFGLSNNLPSVTVNGRDPAIVSSDDEAEALLDVEWAGAVAPAAKINLVVSATTSATDGATLSADYIVNRNLAPVMVVPFGKCEQAMGTSERNYFRNLWQQAAAQGITVVVASGDSGAAGCDGFWQTTATHGQAVNGLCSTPFNICVGGTQFDEGTTPADYWSSTNASWGQGSALRYIPETAWDESGANSGRGLYGSSGGASSIYAKPSWQKGLGVPADGKRDVPDVSLSAAARDGYLIMIEGGLKALGGTSGAASAFAGIAALLNERTGTRQGNLLPALYSLAAFQNSGQGTYFHDVRTGSNSVPGLRGFNAADGYDMATGLGSVNANALITQWSTAGASQPTFTMTITPSPLSLAQGGSVSFTAGVTFDSRFSGPVTVTVSGLPSGVQAVPASATAKSSGGLTFALSAQANVATGQYLLTVTGMGNGVSMSQFVPLFISAPANSWNLVWSDEFSGARGASPDASKWTFDTGAGGWGNQELQTYTNLPQNASLDGSGNLVIHVEAVGNGYRSARMVTKGRYAAQYGRIEARVKLPAGAGLWPGFWMLGADCDSAGWPNAERWTYSKTKGVSHR